MIFPPEPEIPLQELLDQPALKIPYSLLIATFNSLRNDNFFRVPVFYGGTTPDLSDNAETFPDAYGMISSADILINTLMMIAMEEDWNWGNIAVLYDETRQHFTQTYTAFAKRFKDSQEIGYIRQIADS